MLASSFPLLDAFLSILYFMLFFLWIWILIAVIGDLFRSQDLSGWGKALWFVALLFLPFFGVFLYLLIRGHKMHARAEAAAEAQEMTARSYIRSVASDRPPSTADELERLAKLRDAGVLSQAEFDSEKSKVLGGAASA
jgi:hypothetical protein